MNIAPCQVGTPKAAIPVAVYDVRHEPASDKAAPWAVRQSGALLGRFASGAQCDEWIKRRETFRLRIGA